MRSILLRGLSLAALTLVVPDWSWADGSLPTTPPVKLRIPLRIVQALTCNPVLPSCGKETAFADAQVALERANFHWKSVGIEFWIKSYERVQAPHFNAREEYFEYPEGVHGPTIPLAAPLSWSTVKAELRAIFPNMPDSAYTPGMEMQPTAWMQAAATFFADPNEVFVWTMSGQPESRFPWQGRFIMLDFGKLGVGDSGLPATTFGHELGHFLGLRHTDATGLQRHPSAGLEYDFCAFWDQFYYDAAIPVFFDGPSDPLCMTDDDDVVRPIQEIFDLRATASDAMATSFVGPLLMPAGSPQVAGVFASTGLTHQPPQWGYATNLMGHLDLRIGVGDDGDQVDGRTPRFISSSQRELIWDYLTWDMSYDAESMSDMTEAPFYYGPVGSIPGSSTSLRTELGKSNDDYVWWSNAPLVEAFSFQSAPQEVSLTDLVPMAGDFNCDHKDDLAWYRPSTGALKIWWGTTGHSFNVDPWTTQPADRRVFAGDFDGNGCSDLFFYGPGSLSDKILYGKSGQVFVESVQTVSGTIYHPFAADLEGDGDDDIVWYKASAGFADIWYGNGSTQSSASTGTTFTKTTGKYVGTGKFYTPLVGNFDGVGGDEVFWYAAGEGTDPLWKWQGSIVESSQHVDGFYRPIVGDLNGDGRDDILWDSTNSLRSPIWEGAPNFGLFTQGHTANNVGDHLGIAGDFDGNGADDIFFYRGTMQLWADSFHYGQGWRTDQHVRVAGDVNGDNKVDLVGFGNSGVEVLISTGSTFKPMERWLDAFNNNAGWRVDRHPRFLVDVGGDSKPDVVGFGNNDVQVALSVGTDFGSVNNWLHGLTYNDNWLVDRNPREMADVTGDHKADIVAFGNSAVQVATSNGVDGFNPPTNWVTGFNYNSGWLVTRHPRLLADADGDGKADIIGFANGGVRVSYSEGTYFTPDVQKVSNFGYDQGWKIDKHPRFMADVNGDQKADIVGFANDGVLVSLSTGRNFAAPQFWSNDFGYDDGWYTQLHPRFVEDVNGDGRADVVGFANRTVLVAFSTGTSFSEPIEWIDEYTADNGGWITFNHPRLITDVTGDGRADIVGFGESSGTYVTPSRWSFKP